MAKFIKLTYCLLITNINSTNSYSLKDILEMSKMLIDIFTALATGICVIMGLGLVKSLKEKQFTATFSFSMQLKVRIKEIRKRLEGDFGYISNFYDVFSRKNWDCHIIPSEEEISEFYSLVKELLDFLKKATDQLPNYRGWTKDFDTFTEFLYDVIQFDIRNSNEKFKFQDKTIEDRNKYAKDICSIMRRLEGGISKEQKKKEKLLHRKDVAKKKKKKVKKAK